MVSLGKGDEAGDRKQIDRDQQWDRDSWEARLYFENGHKMPHHDEEMCSDNRRAPKQLLLHPNCTQIRGFSVLGVELSFGANGAVSVSDERGWNHEAQNAFQVLTKDDIMIS